MASWICKKAALRILLFLLGVSFPALATAREIPRMPNGRIDVAAVLSSFKSTTDLTGNGLRRDFNGELLGEPFHAHYEDSADPLTYVLTIRSERLSEEAIHLTAIILSDVICLRENHRYGEVKWIETSVQVGQSWRVSSTCSREARLQPSSGG